MRQRLRFNWKKTMTEVRNYFVFLLLLLLEINSPNKRMDQSGKYGFKDIKLNIIIDFSNLLVFFELFGT